MTWLNPCSLAGLLLSAGIALAPPPAHAQEDPLVEAMAGEFAVQTGDFQAAARHYLNAARASDDPALAERAAQAAMLAGDPALARQAVARWTELDPDSRGLLATRAIQAMRADDTEGAVDALASLLALPEEGGSRVVLQVLSGTQDEALAGRVLSGLLQRDALPGDDFQAWLAFAGLAQRWGDPELTTTLVSGAVSRFPDEPRAWLLKAAQLRVEGDLGGARAAVERALAAEPGDTGLRIAAAGELERMGDAEAAERVLAEATQDDTIFSTRAAYLARARDNSGLADLADEIEASLADSPGPASAVRRLLLGQISEYLGQFEAAVRWYASVPEGRVWAQAQLRTARAEAARGRLEEALEVLRSLQLDYDSDGEVIRDAYLFEAELYTQAGRDTEALAAYGRGLGIFEDDPLLLYARALAWVAMDRIAEAEVDLRRILVFEPDNAAALNALGYTLADRTDRHEEALGYIERALALDPGNPAIIDSLGWVLYRLGRVPEALEHLERAWSILPDAEIGAHLGEVLWSLGERREARRIWSEARELDAENEVLKETMERLDR
ncbi:tetratricopeptide repeat protein [Alkalisalibacterium limincola]|nr:tetratricopeptide repeat protein [Alkalisalibacterium limincola]